MESVFYSYVVKIEIIHAKCTELTNNGAHLWLPFAIKWNTNKFMDTSNKDRTQRNHINGNAYAWIMCKRGDTDVEVTLIFAGRQNCRWFKNQFSLSLPGLLRPDLSVSIKSSNIDPQSFSPRSHRLTELTFTSSLWMVRFVSSSALILSTNAESLGDNILVSLWYTQESLHPAENFLMELNVRMLTVTWFQHLTNPEDV